MKHTPAPLTWPVVVPVEVASRYLDAANLAFDHCFEEQPLPLDPAALMAAQHAATQASVLEYHMRLDAPIWQ